MKKYFLLLVFLVASAQSFAQIPTPGGFVRPLLGNYNFIYSDSNGVDTVKLYPGFGVNLKSLWTDSIATFGTGAHTKTLIHNDTIRQMSRSLVSFATCTTQFYSEYLAAKIRLYNADGNEFRINAIHDCTELDSIVSNSGLAIEMQNNTDLWLNAYDVRITPSDSLIIDGDVVIRGSLTVESPGCAAYLNTPDTTTITTEGTFYPIEGTFTNMVINQFTNVATPAIKYTGTETAYFEIDWHATIRANVASTTVHCGVKVGGTLVTGSEMSTLCKTADEEYTLSGTVVVQLSTNSEVQLVVTSDGNGDLITFDHYTTTIRKFF